MEHDSDPECEKPKRLTPKQDILRQLFLMSGNLCAIAYLLPVRTASTINSWTLALVRVKCAKLRRQLPDLRQMNPVTRHLHTAAFRNVSRLIRCSARFRLFELDYQSQWLR
jgi:hypothetical protein